MFTTIESRWFFIHEPKEILAWFEALPAWPMVSKRRLRFGVGGERSDFYLLLDGYSKMSLKIRDGSAEIKVLEEVFGVHQFSDDARGFLEKWNKVTVPLKAPYKIPGDIFGKTQQFLEVKKDRMLLSYEVDRNGDMTRADPERTEVKNGGHVELTKIKCGTTDFFSFAIEAFGDDLFRKQHFDVLSASVFTTLYSGDLTEGNSYNYPTWLLQLAKGT